jgi:thiopeptide-type bacteriocin biosynthesis protein
MRKEQQLRAGVAGRATATMRTAHSASCTRIAFAPLRVTRPSFTPAPFFAWRTPLLPLAELTGFGAELRAAAADAAQLAGTLASDRRLLRERLRAIVDRPEVREALFVASPSLDESLPAWLEAPDSERGRKVERTLVRYLARMCARPTPFGLFAGCSLGTVGDHTRLELAARVQYRRHTRLDGDYLSSLCDQLARDPSLRAQLVYRPNSSLYRAAGQLRYAEAHFDGNRRSYRLAAVEPSAYIEATLERARPGSALAALAAPLVDDEISADEAAAFVAELVDTQLLVADLEPLVTGAESLDDLLAQLRGQPAAGTLEQARAALQALDGRAPGAPLESYHAVAARLRALPAKVELSRLFQVDLVKPATASLGPAPVDELVRVVSLLHRLAPRREDPLARFRAAFTQRYEAREVPLAEVLDVETGIGFDQGGDGEVAPLLKGLAFDGRAQPAAPPAGHLFELLVRRLEDALRTGADEIVLTEAELEPFAAPNPSPMPDSFAVLATLLAPSAAAVDAGEFRVHLQSVSGPSGANLLGRFCHGDPELAGHVRQHLRVEEARRPDAVFVEIVHLPEGRIGNILVRPQLRTHELVYLGRSGAPADQQLRLEDLTVSVVGGRVVLRAPRLGREIVPRLTTAHAFADPRNLGVYRFLCALQYQDVPVVRFDWGALERAPWLPRVRIGRTLLALARWRLSKAELAPLRDVDGDALFAAVQALGRRLRLPRWVTVTDGDNLLPVDLENVLSVETFVHLVKDRAEVALTEMRSDAAGVARGPEGLFVHELVLPLMPAPQAAAPPRHPVAVAGGRRSYLPGSEWLYAKLYGGSATADEVLRRVIAPLVANARASGAVDSWFFLRYADPDPHLRVRFHGNPRRLMAEVLPALHAAAEPALLNGQLWRVQLDTYERELERYGGADGIALAEALFCADSDAALGIVETLAGDAAANARWRIVLRGMDQLLDDLGFDLPARHALLVACRDGFARELGGGVAVTRGIGDKFRRERGALEALLSATEHDFAPALRLFAARSERARAIGRALRALPTPIEDLAASYLHMHANRLLRGAARAQERVLYDFLTRLYETRLARRRQGAHG